MKSQFQSLLTRRSLWRITAVWLAGLFLLAIGLTACGGQTQNNPSAPATFQEGTDGGANVQVAPAASQTTTGFNIDGWF
jgi:hypothetical protein